MLFENLKSKKNAVEFLKLKFNNNDDFEKNKIGKKEKMQQKLIRYM
jgi:hypothetical protein